MAKESEWQIEQRPHFRDQFGAEFLDVDNRLFLHPAKPAGRLNRDDLDGRIKKLGPTAIDGRAAARKRKTEQPQPGKRPGTCNDKPPARGLLSGSPIPFFDGISILRITQIRQDIVDDLRNARSLDQLDSGNSDAEGCFESVDQRYRHQRIEAELSKRTGCIDLLFYA